MKHVIACDSFLSLRNVRNGDLHKWLDDLHVFVDPNQLEGSRAAAPAAVTVRPLAHFDYSKEPELERRLTATVRARKSYRDTRAYWAKLYSSATGYNGSAARKLVSFGAAIARFGQGWTQGALGRDVRERRENAGRLANHPIALDYRKLFAEHRPSSVVGFSPEAAREWPFVEAARAAQIPTAVMIRSRDNIGSKITHLPLADRYLVWSQATKDFLLQLYPEVAADRVVVTGSPQFDRHLDPSFRLTREEFFAQIELDPTRPLVVYTTATPGLIAHEIDIAQHLADAAERGALAGGAQLLVRGHPRMFGSDVRLLHRESANARVYPKAASAAYRSAQHEARVVQLILEDEPMHLATLAYQDVQVNVCGTMTIDSAILDKPTVNVYYDLVSGVPFGKSVRRFYERSDVQQMMSYGSSRLARTAEDCIRLINDYLENPTTDSEGRRRAREQDCGPLDGSAGRRVAEAILAL
jgi:hypothetical protein